MATTRLPLGIVAAGAAAVVIGWALFAMHVQRAALVGDLPLMPPSSPVATPRPSSPDPDAFPPLLEGNHPTYPDVRAAKAGGALSAGRFPAIVPGEATDLWEQWSPVSHTWRGGFHVVAGPDGGPPAALKRLLREHGATTVVAADDRGLGKYDVDDAAGPTMVSVMFIYPPHDAHRDQLRVTCQRYERPPAAK